MKKTSSEIKVRLVEDEAERQQVYRLRYQTFYEENGWTPDGIDHENRILTDSLDERGYIFAAFDGEQVVGTMRANFGADGDLGEWTAHYKLEQFGQYFPEYIGIATRVAVAPEYRCLQVFSALGLAIVRLGYERKLEFAFLSGPLRQAKLYQRFGWQHYIPPFELPGYCKAVSLCFVFSDIEYLHSINSRVLGVASEYLHTPEAVAFFHQVVAHGVQLHNVLEFQEGSACNQ